MLFKSYLLKLLLTVLSFFIEISSFTFIYLLIYLFIYLNRCFVLQNFRIAKKAEPYFQHTESTFSSNTRQSMKRRIFLYLFIYLFIHLFVYLFIYVFIYLLIYLFTYMNTAESMLIISMCSADVRSKPNYMLSF